MAETDVHIDQIIALREGLRAYFHDRPDVYVSGCMMFYSTEGEWEDCVSPDLFVVFGIPNHQRRVYKLWEEGKVPNLVVEVTSKKTKGDDLLIKRDLYEQIGVPEYVLYDPTGDYLRPPLQVFHLVQGRYVPQAVPGGRLRSIALNLEWRAEEGRLRLFDPRRGEYLLSPEEEFLARCQAEARAEAAESRAEAEAQARIAAEAELARLREELARLRGES
jgi:Uma2 family endonuclease